MNVSTDADNIAPQFWEMITSKENLNHDSRKIKFYQKIGRTYSNNINLVHSRRIRRKYTLETVRVNGLEGGFYRRHPTVAQPRFWYGYVGSPVFLRNGITSYVDMFEPIIPTNLSLSIINALKNVHDEKVHRSNVRLQDELQNFFNNETAYSRKYRNYIIRMAHAFHFIPKGMVPPVEVNFHNDLFDKSTANIGCSDGITPLDQTFFLGNANGQALLPAI